MKSKLFNTIFLMAVLYLFFFTFAPKTVYCLDSYILTLTVKDSEGNPLNGALVRVTTVYGPDDYRSFYNETNENGVAVFNLKSAQASALVRIIWKGVTVALEDVTLQSPETSATIYCSVSSLNIMVLQANGNPIKNAFVTLRWEVDIPWKLEAYSDADGMVVFTQMPHYNGYTLSIRWKGKTVYQGSLTFNGGTQTFQAKCNVYDLTIKVFDKRQTPIPEAQITLTREDSRQENGQTNNNGVATFKQLTIGNYTLKISYSSETFQTNLFLTSDQEVQVTLNTTILLKYYLEIHAKWTDEKPAGSINVEIWNIEGKKVAYGITDNSGTFKKQLTEGNYTVKISINGYVESQSVTLSSDMTLDFTISTEHRTSTVTVKVFDKKGNPASGAEIEIFIENMLFTSGITNSDGIATFNLPDGVYTIFVTYNGESLTQTVNVTEDQIVPFSFRVQVDISEILIGIGILSIPILILSLAFLYVRRRRNERLKLDSHIKELKKLKLKQSEKAEE